MHVSLNSLISLWTTNYREIGEISEMHVSLNSLISL